MTDAATPLTPHLATILDRLAEAVTVQDANGRLVYANDAAARLLGFDHPRALVAADPAQIVAAYDMLDEDGKPIEAGRLPGRRVIAGEQPDPLLIQYIDRDTAERRFTVTKASPIADDDGRVVFAVNIVEDVTDLVRVQREQRLLAEASRTLALSLDPATTVETVAWALVPEVADWASVHLPDERGRLRLAAVAHIEHEKMDMTRSWLERYPPELGDAVGVGAVQRTGKPELYADIPDDLLQQVARDADHLALMRAVGYRSALSVPLMAGGETLGVMSCATAPTRRRFDARDLALAEALGRRAGTALGNAREHEGRVLIAQTLQRSLLPPSLPQVPGLEMAARFRAAEAGSEVGGDFYEVFEAGGAWHAVIGDVTGKGPAAAGVTGLARYTLRTAALYENGPSAVLDRLNATLLAEQRQSSAAILRLERTGDGFLATVACAGHPPPYVLRAGEAPAALGRPGTLGGAFPGGSWPETAGTLRQGDTVFLYTDGATDARGEDGRFELRRLVALLDGLTGESPEAVVGSVDEALRRFQVGRQRDDIALLAIRVG